jgi:hypothetical protein
MKRNVFARGTALLACGLLGGVAVSVQADTGRLLATGGATQIEGAGGGGVVPWALISGLGTEDEVGGTAFFTHVGTESYGLNTLGAAVNFHNRFELSYAYQRLGVNLPDAGISTHIAQDVFGIKYRLLGDAIFAQDSMMPQVSLGIQYKRNRNFDTATPSGLGVLPGIPQALGAKDDSGVDFYAAMTKVFLGGFFGHNLLINGTVRATKANQMGLLGFGGPTHDNYRAAFEGSVGVFLDEGNRVLLGGEFRQNPDNGLSYVTPGLKQGNYADAFIAYIPNKNIALVAAYADLGDLPLRAHETGPYLSLQATF